MQLIVQPRHYPIRWLIAALSMLLGITFFPYLFGGKTFLPADLFDTMTAPSDSHYGPSQAQNHYVFDALAQELPYKIQTKEAFERSKLAYWNPYILGGYPQYAECLGNNFDPLNILLLWFDPIEVIHWETVIELLIAGVGMLLLLRFFGISPLVNLLFSAGYMLNSMFISSMHYRSPVAAFCWMPFVMLMIVRYFTYRRRLDVCYAAIFLALAFLGGNFQTAFFSVFVIAVLIFMFPIPDGKYSFAKRIGVFLLIGFSSFCLSAIMWLPSLELLYNTIFLGGSLHSTNIFDVYTITQRALSIPLAVAMLFLPEILGSAQSYNLRKFAGVDIINFNGAIGFCAALFALWGCVRLWKIKTIRPFIVIGILGITLPIATPLFSIVYHRFFIVSSLAFCVVGARAFQSFLDNEKLAATFTRYFHWTKIIYGSITALLIGLSIYIGVNYQSVHDKILSKVQPMIAASAFGSGNESWMIGRVAKTLDYYQASPALWIPIFLVLIIIIVISLYRRRKITRAVLLIVILFATSAELCISARTWLSSLNTNEFPIYPESKIISYLKSLTGEGRYTVWRDPSKDPYLLAENAPNVYHLSDIHGYEVCSNRSMAIFYERNVHADTLDLRLLGLANVRYILVRKQIVHSPNLRPLFSSNSMTVYENLLARPRAYMAYHTLLVESDKEATAQLLRPDFDGSTALFERGDDPPPDTSYNRGGENTIQFEKTTSEEIVINAESFSKGILILTDTYYPGWQCWVNGKQTPIHRVNYCMRGIVLEQGRSKIVFKFEPGVLTLGAALSLATLMGTLVLIFTKRNDHSPT